MKEIEIDSQSNKEEQDINFDNTKINMYAVIPAYVFLSDKISDSAKILYGAISLLCNKYGYCYATNKKLSEFKKLKERQVQYLLKELEDQNFIYKILYINKTTKQVIERRLFIDKACYDFCSNLSDKPENCTTPSAKNCTTPSAKNCTTPSAKNCMENIINNNNTRINITSLLNKDDEEDYQKINLNNSTHIESKNSQIEGVGQKLTNPIKSKNEGVVQKLDYPSKSDNSSEIANLNNLTRKLKQNIGFELNSSELLSLKPKINKLEKNYSSEITEKVILRTCEQIKKQNWNDIKNHVLYIEATLNDSLKVILEKQEKTNSKEKLNKNSEEKPKATYQSRFTDEEKEKLLAELNGRDKPNN